LKLSEQLKYDDRFGYQSVKARFEIHGVTNNSDLNPIISFS